MALIARFEERPLTPSTVHRPVLCGYTATEVQGQRLLQLETYGTEERKNIGTASQVIQLDLDAARQLVSILRRSFPEL